VFQNNTPLIYTKTSKMNGLKKAKQIQSANPNKNGMNRANPNWHVAVYHHLAVRYLKYIY